LNPCTSAGGVETSVAAPQPASADAAAAAQVSAPSFDYDLNRPQALNPWNP